VHAEKEQRGRRKIDGNLPLDRQSTRTLASSGGGSASAARWGDLASEGEWRGSK
jgi:hypothetical protein